MAKIFLIIICVCTACVHLAWTQMARKNAEQSHKWTASDIRQPHRYDSGLRPQGHHHIPRTIDDTSDLENGSELNNIGMSGLKHKYNTQPELVGNKLDHNTLIRKQLQRIKRHAGHSHADEVEHVEINPNTDRYITKIFKRFSNSDHEMNLVQFENMMKELGLDRIIEAKHSNNPNRPEENSSDADSHINNSLDAHSNGTCISAVSLISDAVPAQSADRNRENILKYQKLINETRGQSKLSKELLYSVNATDATDNETSIKTIKSIKENINLGKNDLLSLCPILLYQVVTRSGCITTPMLPSEVHHGHDDHALEDEDRKLVWIYASLSIIVASLCGLIGVAVIPCMEKRFYNSILQFFVALAIGTLAGDALLHLMPHAMMTFSAHQDQHTSMTYKGLVASLGIIFFFVTERVLAMIAECRERIQKRDNPPTRVRVMRDPDSISVNQSLNAEKQCKHKYSSYPYCYDEIALDTKDNIHQHHSHGSGHSHTKENGVKVATTSSPKEKLCAKTLNDRAGDHSDTAQSLLNSRNHNNINVTDAYYRTTDKDDIQTPDNNTILTNLDDTSLDACGCEPSKTTPENYTIILREHESKHHGHSHTHGHVHSPPKTLSAVAWMVVMADGLHNFTDGMAIGAAFANSIPGGFSTAIAVFCHELPHELGDFAVLLKAGMSARKAAYYNILSSVLSFLGMIVGVLIGETPEASAWIFACAAGMFIYIALVDMMPELTTAHNKHSAVRQCFLQVVGMVVGVSIMLLIALFEDNLRTIFSDDHDHLPHHH